MLVLAESDPASPEAALLFGELDAELRGYYPSENVHGLSPAEVAAFEGVFLLAWLDGALVGCGGLRPLGPDVGEVKRMYVRPAARGRGVARRLLAALEAAAAAQGFRAVRLETGKGLQAAIRLYDSAGYAPIACFGEYAGDPYSVCYEKRL
jgi:ribosomal protein S18 acetylase RimI-like enzyme